MQGELIQTDFPVDTNAHEVWHDEILSRQQREAERLDKISAYVSNWQKNAEYVAWKSGPKQLEDMTMEEAKLANQELLSLRRRELKILLDRDHAKYESELRAKGLSFHHNRI